MGSAPAVRWWGVLQLIPSVIFALTMAAAPASLVSEMEDKDSVG